MLRLASLTDGELTANFRDLVISEREQLVLQLDYIREIDRRKLFFGYSSLWALLVEEHNMDESHAERKIRAARIMNRVPQIKEMLESGKLNLSLLGLAQGVATREKLSDPEFLELLEAISNMSCKAAKLEIATRYPRYLELPADRINPINADYSEVTFVAHNVLLDKLNELQGLLAHTYPQVKIRDLIEVMANDYYERHHPEPKARRAKEREEKRKEKEEAEKPSSKKVNEAQTEPKIEEKSDALLVELEVEARRFPQAMIHALVRKEGYCCSWVDPDSGEKCNSSWGLERHHIQSYFSGGTTKLENACWLCASHHARATFLEFGELPYSTRINR